MCSFYHHQEIPCQEEDLTHIWKIQHCDLKRGPPNSGVPRRQHVQTCMVDATQQGLEAETKHQITKDDHPPKMSPEKGPILGGYVSFSGGGDILYRKDRKFSARQGPMCTTKSLLIFVIANHVQGTRRGVPRKRMCNHGIYGLFNLGILGDSNPRWARGVIQMTPNARKISASRR